MGGLLLRAVVFLCVLAGALGASAAPDPYPLLSGGSFGPAVLASPDPLASYTWDMDSLRQGERFGYQLYYDSPVNATGTPTASFSGLHTLVGNGSAARAVPASSAVVKGDGTITLRFAAEGPSWLEFDSPELAAAEAAGASVSITISENRFPGANEAKAPTRYDGAGPSTYRLELNPALYEGVRYAFITVTGMDGKGGVDGADAGGAAPAWTINALRRVSQAIPANYEGSFDSSDGFLTRLWYVGAFTTRATFVSSVSPAQPRPTNDTTAYLGSILMNRGDRIAFLGDAHVAQATALAAFGSSVHPLLAMSNEYLSTVTHDGNIEPYKMMWVLSVVDYLDASGDKRVFARIAPKVIQQLVHARDVVYPAAVAGNAALAWSRDDDRMGFGFEYPDIPHAQCAYRALTAEAASRFGAAYATINATAGSEWAALGAAYGAAFGGVDTRWWEQCGMHATGDAVNAGVPPTNATSDTSAAAAVARKDIVARWFSDPLQLASLSPFESFFMLKALLALGLEDEALYLTHRQWGTMIASGATMTWERFDPQFADAGAVRGNGSDDAPVNSMNDRTSMAHPWSSAATALLSRYALGVVPAPGSGFVTWTARPRFLLRGDNGAMAAAGVRGWAEGPHRLEWVAGAVPTSRGLGPVRLAAHARPLPRDGDGGGGRLRVALAVTAPRGTSGAVELPVPPAFRNGSFVAHLVRSHDAGLLREGTAGTAHVRALQDIVARAVGDDGACSGGTWAGFGFGSGNSKSVRRWSGRAGTEFKTATTCGDDCDRDSEPLFGGHTYLLCWEANTKPQQPSSSSSPPRRQGAAAVTWDARTAPDHFNYSVAFRGEDKRTGGAWRGKYGTKGYVLFNYSGVQTARGASDAIGGTVDEVMLPPFIEAVWAGNREESSSFAPLGGRAQCKFDGPFALARADGGAVGAAGGAGIIGSKGSCAAIGSKNASDPRVPQAPNGGPAGFPSVISAIGWKGSFHVDIKVKDTDAGVDSRDSTNVTRNAPAVACAPYNVTLYFADYARWHIRQVVLAAELATQDKVALPVLVQNFGAHGAYLTYEACCSLRFRVHQVHSEQGDRQGWAPPPVMSAVFFD